MILSIVMAGIILYVLWQAIEFVAYLLSEGLLVFPTLILAVMGWGVWRLGVAYVG